MYNTGSVSSRAGMTNGLGNIRMISRTGTVRPMQIPHGLANTHKFSRLGLYGPQ